jgi:hypothetical protein
VKANVLRRGFGRIVIPGKSCTLVGSALTIGFFLCGCQSSIVVPITDSTDTRVLTLDRPVPYFPQETDGTCWLACARMIYSFYGQNFTEAQMNDRIKALTADDRKGQEKASHRECLVALAQEQGWLEHVRAQWDTPKANGGRSVSINVDFIAAISAMKQGARTHEFHELEDALQRHEPAVIVCQIGPWTDAEHAMVVTQMIVGGEGASMGVVSISVLDPAEPTGPAKTYPAEYLQKNLKEIYTRSVAKAILDAEMKAVKVSS